MQCEKTPRMPTLFGQDIKLDSWSSRPWLRHSFCLRSGEILHIKGQNGVGKSTFLRLVAGLLPYTGHLYWKDGGIVEPIHANQVSFLGSDLEYSPETSVKHILDYMHTLRGSQLILNTEASAPILEGIETSTVWRYLSTGQKKRCALYALSINSKYLWVLDEPFAHLDSAGKSILTQHITSHLDVGGVLIYTGHESELMPQHSIHLERN